MTDDTSEITEEERRLRVWCADHNVPKFQDKYGDLRCIKCEADIVALRRIVPLAVATIVLLIIAALAFIMAASAI